MAEMLARTCQVDQSEAQNILPVRLSTEIGLFIDTLRRAFGYGAAPLLDQPNEGRRGFGLAALRLLMGEMGGRELPRRLAISLSECCLGNNPGSSGGRRSLRRRRGQPPAPHGSFPGVAGFGGVAERAIAVFKPDFGL